MRVRLHARWCRRVHLRGGHEELTSIAYRRQPLLDISNADKGHLRPKPVSGQAFSAARGLGLGAAWGHSCVQRGRTMRLGGGGSRAAPYRGAYSWGFSWWLAAENYLGVGRLAAANLGFVESPHPLWRKIASGASSAKKNSPKTCRFPFRTCTYRLRRAACVTHPPRALGGKGRGHVSIVRDGPPNHRRNSALLRCHASGWRGPRGPRARARATFWWGTLRAGRPAQRRQRHSPRRR